MQTKSLRWIAYPTTRIIDNPPPEATERERKTQAVQRLRKAGCNLKTACAALGISRATYYRWRGRLKQQGIRGLVPRSRRLYRGRSRQYTAQEARLAWDLRRQYPTYGKLPLWRILVREYGFTASASTVGRILAKGVRLGRIQPCAYYAQGQVKPKRRRPFTSHAQRWRYGQRATQPGELIQLDHLSVCLLPGKVIKDFKAICPVSSAWRKGHTAGPPPPTPSASCAWSSSRCLSRYAGFRLTAAASSWPGLPGLIGMGLSEVAGSTSRFAAALNATAAPGSTESCARSFTLNIKERRSSLCATL